MRAFFFIIALLPAAALAEPTLELSISGPGEIFPGDPQSTSIDARGQITVGPGAVQLAQSPDRAVVSMAAGPGGVLYVGAARGGITRISGNGKTKRFMEEEQLVVSALTFNKGKLYAATSPAGVIHALDGGGNKRTFFDPAAQYIWSMVPDGRGGLYVGTGKPGRVLQLSRAGKSSVLLDPDETHVRALIMHPTLGLIAGGGQKGVVYQIKNKKPYALYDSAMEEVTAFAIDPKTNDLYVSLVSGSKPGATQPEKWIGPVKGDAPPDDTSPIKGSEVVRIRANGAVDMLWSSKTEGALGLAFDPSSGRLYFSTATGRKGRGRVYAVDPGDRDRVLLWTRLSPPMATALQMAPTKGALIVGTAPEGQVVRVGPGLRKKSVYVSKEQDLRRISTIGRIWFDADVPPGAKVEVAIRSGNTAIQDNTWSSWSGGVLSRDGGPVRIPRGRYVQIKATLSASGRGQPPVVKSLHASVIRMNEPPEVRSVFVLRRGVYMKAMPPEEEKEKTVTLSKSVIRDLRKPFSSERKRIRVRQGIKPGMMTVAWNAYDRNGDGLLYRVEMRSVDRGSPFVEVADDLQHAFYSFDSRTHPDGTYQFRVTATDRPTNPPADAQTDDNLSEPFVIDNGPPKIVGLKASSPGRGQLRIEASVEDAMSPLGSAEFSVGGGPWLMLPAQDGLIDAKNEKLVADVAERDGPGAPKLEKGKQTVLVRIEDEAGNSATASTILNVR